MTLKATSRDSSVDDVQNKSKGSRDKVKKQCKDNDVNSDLEVDIREPSSAITSKPNPTKTTRTQKRKASETQLDTVGNESQTHSPNNKNIKKNLASTPNSESDESDNDKESKIPKSLKKKQKRKSKKKKLKSVKDSNQLNLECVEYLNKWKHDRGNWKFEKVKQIRLVSNVLDKEKLPDKSFPIFLEYMAGASESMKNLLTAKSTNVVEEKEMWENKCEEEKLTTPKVNEDIYERARSILQCYQ